MKSETDWTQVGIEMWKKKQSKIPSRTKGKIEPQHTQLKRRKLTAFYIQLYAKKAEYYN